MGMQGGWIQPELVLSLPRAASEHSALVYPTLVRSFSLLTRQQMLCQQELHLSSCQCVLSEHTGPAWRSAGWINRQNPLEGRRVAVGSSGCSSNRGLQ